MKIKKERKRFNNDYIPVIVSSIVLLLLILGLVVVVLFNPKSEDSNNTTSDSGKYSVSKDDIVVNTSSTKCSSNIAKTIAKEASKVSVSFDLTTYTSDEEIYMDGELSEGDYYEYEAYDLQFTNITKNIYLKITNDSNDETKTLKYDDVKNGVASYVSIYIAKKVKYTVTVFSADESCAGEVYRKFTFTTPIYNVYSQNCRDSKSNVCKPVVDEEVSAQEVINSNVSYEKEREQEKEEKKDYTLIIAAAIIIVGVIGVITYIVINKKKVKRNE